MHLLFVGCSWVAGDAVAWDLICPGAEWRIDSPLYRDYCSARKPYTLAHLTAQRLGCSYTDLSRDGISNLSIALEALDYIRSYRGDDLVVCAGWTDPARRRAWENDQWIDLGIQYLDDPHLPREWREYIRHAIVLRSEQDHLQDYAVACGLLAHVDRLVQWRSVGEPVDPAGLSIDSKGWLSEPWGASWHSRLASEDRISTENLHPNRAEVARHAARIAERIQCS